GDARVALERIALGTPVEQQARGEKRVHESWNEGDASHDQNRQRPIRQPREIGNPWQRDPRRQREPGQTEQHRQRELPPHVEERCALRLLHACRRRPCAKRRFLNGGELWGHEPLYAADNAAAVQKETLSQPPLWVTPAARPKS